MTTTKLRTKPKTSRGKKHLLFASLAAGISFYSMSRDATQVFCFTHSAYEWLGIPRRGTKSGMARLECLEWKHSCCRLDWNHMALSIQVSLSDSQPVWRLTHERSPTKHPLGRCTSSIHRLQADVRVGRVHAASTMLMTFPMCSAFGRVGGGWCLCHTIVDFHSTHFVSLQTHNFDDFVSFSNFDHRFVDFKTTEK